ncbi:hypothetical protein LPN04_13745 [Rugamonas sp. A1-17]|nr:hypothetical protein [Rugamonas sp. A1-17]
MLAYDAAHPAVFFHADRATERWNVIQGWQAALDSGAGAQFLATHGNAGDYLVQAVLYQWLGELGVIMVQVCLALWSGWAVMRIALLLGLSERAAAATAGLYLLLPHTLVFPHQLASEAIYLPLLVVSLELVARAMIGGKAGAAGIGGAVLAGANLVRPITMLWPAVVALLMARAGRWRAAAAHLLWALVPVLAWMSFVGAQTGHFGMGDSSRDVGHNLYQRLARTSETLAPAQAAQVRQTYLNQGETGSLPPLRYLHFACEHPGAFLRHSLRDVAVFFGKSGIERLSIDYLEVGGSDRRDLQRGDAGWRTHLEREGTWSTLQFLWREQGTVLLISLAGAALMVAFSLAALAGIQVLWRGRRQLTSAQRGLALLLVALPLYILVFSQLVDAMQSRHRAPAEAALMLLAGLGVSKWRRGRRPDFAVAPVQ